MVTAKRVPQVFNRIEFGTVSGQRNDCDVVGNLQLPTAVESSSIPDHHHVHVLGDGLSELAKEGVHHIRIHVRCHDRFRLSGLRTDGTNHVERIVLRLANRRHTRSATGPQTSQRTLLAEACFVLKKDLQLFVRMQTL